MSKYIVTNSDVVTFDTAFGEAGVATAVPPLITTITGTGHAHIGEKNMCILGDEENVSLPGVSYSTKTHSVPGTATLTIKSLDDDQKASYVLSDAQVIIVGSKFHAILEVDTAAKTPEPASLDDPITTYTGTGTFTNSNKFVQVS
ncbi:hypothetical protein Sps_01437 [Shewanella psychrophila]|uniref:Uncharacterized protein n=1 Tax=Shewanella psychrophila TaxID=225848 RepID=A0A1S6HM67_9GAMM|nr:hypothetical protein [Shewanella psychrophila]AQS36603.1 hypothetical protein Sps_01437 [Shewanella psychrophila]